MYIYIYIYLYIYIYIYTLIDINNVTSVLNTIAEQIFNCYGQINLTKVLNSVSTKFVLQCLTGVLNQISRSDELILIYIYIYINF